MSFRLGFDGWLDEDGRFRAGTTTAATWGESSGKTVEDESQGLRRLLTVSVDVEDEACGQLKAVSLDASVWLLTAEVTCVQVYR